MDVFLSFVSEKDRAFAERLTNDLRAHGIRVWADAELKPGGNWVQAVTKGVRTSHTFVVIVSSATADNPFFSTELATALAASETSEGRRIVPILADREARLPPFLNQFSSLDASTPNKYELTLQELIRLFGNDAKNLAPIDSSRMPEKIQLNIIETISLIEKSETEIMLKVKRIENRFELIGKLTFVLFLSSFIATTSLLLIYSAKYDKYDIVKDLYLLIASAVGAVASFIAGRLSASSTRHAPPSEDK